MHGVHVAGVGITPFGKYPGSLRDLMMTAGAAALKDAGRDTVDAVYVGTMNPEAFVGEGNVASGVADGLGLAAVPALRVETASSAGAAAVFAGYTAVASGYFQSVLVIGGEKMSHVPSPQVTGILGQVLDPCERAQGATMPALAAIVTRAFMQAFSVTRRDLARVAVKNHYHGSLNPDAQFQRPVSLEEVMHSRLIADPLRLFDCAPISDGAAAVVLTADWASVRVTGIAQGTDHVALRDRDSLVSFRATREAAARAFRMANRKPSDVQVAEVHDAFTSFELMSVEDLGLFPVGRSCRALRSDAMTLSGKIPINPSGGLKARGHPIGATGLAQVVEIVRQLRGQAGDRQVEAAVGLAHSIGGLATGNWVTILERN